MPEVIALDYVLVALNFPSKLCVLTLQIRCAEFAPNGFVLGKLLFQTGNLCLEFCNQPVCSVQSLLQFGLLFPDVTYFFAAIASDSYSERSNITLEDKWDELCLNLFDSCHIDLLILNFLNLSAERRRLLFLLAVLLREFCQPCLLLLHFELRYGQVFLKTASFASLHIVVPGVAHIPEEIILQNAIGLFENRLALVAQNRRTVLVQRWLGSPLLTYADLLDYLLDRAAKRLILAAL